MGFLAKLFGSGNRGSGAGADTEALHIYVRCTRCGEKIHIRANIRTDVVQEYDESGERTTNVLHKEILGSRCQNLMYAHLTLDGAYRVVDSSTERCTLITREEYEADA